LLSEKKSSGGEFRFSSFVGTNGGSYSGFGVIDSDFARVTGHLTPGSSPGTLEFTGDLQIESSAVINFELGALQDLVLVGGDLNLDGLLEISALGGFGVGDYTLFNYGGVFTDNGVQLGAAIDGFRYDLIHDGGNSSVILSVSAVPEPGSLAMLALGTLLFSGWRRRG